MNRRFRSGLVVLAVVLSAAGCGYHPPRPAVRIGVNSFAANVLYGSVPTVAVPGVAPLQYPGHPAAAEGPAGTPQVTAGSGGTPVSHGTPSLPPSACPDAKTATVLHPATNRVDAPPVEASYPFRSTFQVTSGTNNSGVIPLAETRAISNAKQSGDTITYTATATYPTANVSVETDYQIKTASTLPPAEENAVPVAGLAGVYVLAQRTTAPNAKGVVAETVQTWSPPLQVLKLPAAAGTTWAVTSHDTTGGLVESYTAKVDGLEKVNACGAFVQGYRVTLTGSIASPDHAYAQSFVESQLFAPQFGGIVLSDTAEITTPTGPTTSTTQHITDTINVTPSLPGTSS